MASSRETTLNKYRKTASSERDEELNKLRKNTSSGTIDALNYTGNPVRAYEAVVPDSVKEQGAKARQDAINRITSGYNDAVKNNRELTTDQSRMVATSRVGDIYSKDDNGNITGKSTNNGEISQKAKDALSKYYNYSKVQNATTGYASEVMKAKEEFQKETGASDEEFEKYLADYTWLADEERYNQTKKDIYDATHTDSVATNLLTRGTLKAMDVVGSGVAGLSATLPAMLKQDTMANGLKNNHGDNALLRDVSEIYEEQSLENDADFAKTLAGGDEKLESKLTTVFQTADRAVTMELKSAFQMIMGGFLGEMAGAGTFVASEGAGIAEKAMVTFGNHLGQLFTLPGFAFSGFDAEYRDAQERGLDKGNAYATAVVAGASEALTELVSVESMFDLAKTGGKVGLKKVLRQMLCEGSEEYYNDLINNIADLVINTGETKYDDSVAYYQENGMTYYDAQKQAGKDMLGGMFYDFLLGAITGGLGAGGVEVLNVSRQVGNIRTLQKNPSLASAVAGSISTDRADYASKQSYEDASRARAQGLTDIAMLNPNQNLSYGQAKAIYRGAQNASENYVESNVPTEYRTVKQSEEDAISDMKKADSPLSLQRAYESATEQTKSVEKAYKEARARLNKSGITDDQLDNIMTPQKAYTMARNGETLNEEQTKRVESDEKMQSALKAGQNMHTIENNSDAVKKKDGEVAVLDLDNTEFKDGNVEFKDKEGNTVSWEDIDSKSETVSNFANTYGMLESQTQFEKAKDFVATFSDQAKGQSAVKTIYKDASLGVSLDTIISKNGAVLKGIDMESAKAFYESVKGKSEAKNKGGKRGSGVSFTSAEAEEEYKNLSKTKQKFVELLSNKLGVEMVITSNDGLTRGEYSASEGTITLNMAKADKLFSVALHEGIGEFMKAHNAEGYTNVADAIIEYLYNNGDKDIANTAKKYQYVYRTNSTEVDKTIRDSAEEIVNDNMGKIFSDDKQLEKLISWMAKNEKKSALDTIKSYLSDMKAWIKEARSAGKVDGDESLIRDEKFCDSVVDMILRETDVAIKNRNSSSEVESKIGTVDESGNLISENTAQLSLEAYDDFGRAKLEEFLVSQDLDELTKKNIIDELEFSYELAKELADSGEFMEFSSWSDMTVELKPDGTPVLSVVVKNGEYPLNIDFSTICKKRKALNNVLNRLVKSGDLDMITLSQSQVASINRIIKEHKFEIACGICFVDSKRYRVGTWAESFATPYNDLVKSMLKKGVNATDFNFTGRPVKGIKGTALDTVSDADINWKKIDKVLSTYNSGTELYRMANALKTYPELRHFLNKSEIIAGEGLDAIRSKSPELYALVRSHGGTSLPKLSHSEVPYGNEILLNKSFNKKDAFAVGGVRIQSFSDYMANMFFDYVQMLGDLSAKGLPAHAYTKEDAFVKIFGLTGTKINMSGVPAVQEFTEELKERFKSKKSKQALNNDSVYRELKARAGLDENGNYIWSDETFNFEMAKRLRKLPGYDKNCGIIVVGVSDAHITKLLNDPDIDMVIPYHKSGINPVVAKMRKIDMFTDYTKQQNTRYASSKKKVPNSVWSFDFYGDLAKTNDPQQTVRNYVKECEDRGYLPKFDKWVYNEDGSFNDNYYKLIADFRLYDNDGNYAPQQAVNLKFDHDNLKDYLTDSLTEAQETTDRYSEDEDNLVKDIKAMLKDTAKSLDVDSDGNKLTEDQVSYFKNSKVRDAVGNLLKVYHGSETGRHTVFNKKNSDDGLSFFFTDSRSVASGYSGIDKEITGRNHTAIGIRTLKQAQEFFNDIKIEKRGNKYVANGVAEFDTLNDLCDWAWWMSDGNGRFINGGVLSVYLNIENPLVIDADGESWAKIPTGIDTLGIATTRDVAKYAKEKGYDGVIINNVYDNGKYGGYDTSTVYVAFESNQIKFTDNEHPTKEADIRKSLDVDSIGKEITKEQKNFFKNSKARDDSGKLLHLYHGSPEANFTEFDLDEMDDGQSIFLTTSRNVAESYSGSDAEANPYNLYDFSKEEDVRRFFKNSDFELVVSDGEYSLINTEYGDEYLTSDSLEELMEDYFYQMDISEMNGGVYDLYANAENPLIVDADGANWDELSLYDLMGEDAEYYRYIHLIRKEGDKFLIEWAYTGGRGGGTRLMSFDEIESTFGKQISEKANGENLWLSDIAIDENGELIPTNTREISNYAKERGYDSVIINNIVDIGAYSNGEEESTVVILFDPSQAKSVYNEHPTEDKDIRRSIEVLSDGSLYVVLDKDTYRDQNGNAVSMTEMYNRLCEYPLITYDGDKIHLIKHLPRRKNVYSELLRRRPTYFDKEIDIDLMNSEINKNIVESLIASTKTSGDNKDLKDHSKYGIDNFEHREVFLVTDGSAYRLVLAIGVLTNGEKIAYAKSRLTESKEFYKKIEAERTGKLPSQSTSDTIISHDSEKSSKSLEVFNENSPYDYAYDGLKFIIDKMHTNTGVKPGYLKDLADVLIGKYNSTLMPLTLANDFYTINNAVKKGADAKTVMDYAMQIGEQIVNSSTDTIDTEYIYAGIEGATDQDAVLAVAMDFLENYYRLASNADAVASIKQTASEYRDSVSGYYDSQYRHFMSEYEAEREQLKIAHSKGFEKQKQLMSQSDMERLAKEKARYAVNSYKERQERAKKIDSIRRTSERLIKWLNNPTDKKHVPICLQKPLGDFLSAIDLRPSKEGTRLGDKWVGLMSNLSNTLGLIASDDGEMINWTIEADELKAKMDSFVDHANRYHVKSIVNMPLADIRSLDDVMNALSSGINKMNETFANEVFTEVEDLAQNSKSEMLSQGGRKNHSVLGNKIYDFFNLDEAEPLTYFERLGKTSATVFQELRRGFDQKVRRINATGDFMNEEREKLGISLKEVNSWKKQSYTFNAKDGKITLTVPQIMTLYEMMKREQARTHIMIGGVKAGDAEVKVGKITVVNHQAKQVHIDGALVNEITSKLSKNQIAMADALQKYMAVDCANWGNSVTTKMYGYKKFIESEYFPISTDKNSNKSNNSNTTSEVSMRAILNSSFTKELQPNANNAVVLNDIFDVFTNHVVDMANYEAYALPIADAMRWYNYSEDSFEYDEHKLIARNQSTIKTGIDHVFGEQGKQYFVQFIKDINGDKAGAGGGVDLANVLMGMYKAQAIGANLRVVIQQPTAIIRALDRIEGKYLLSAMPTGAGYSKKAQQYSMIANYKAKGYYETLIGQSLKAQITGDQSLRDKLNEFAGFMAGKADDLSWGILWRASELKVSATTNLQYDSDEYIQKTIEVFEDIIDHTQVVDTVFHKSKIMKSQNGFAKMATAFMAEPTKTANMIYRAVCSAPGDKKKTLQAIFKVMWIFVMEQMVNAGVVSIIDALRDDERVSLEESYKEYFKENAVGNLNMLNLYPYLKEIMSAVEGYDPTRMDTQVIYTTVNTLQEINKYQNGESKKTAFGITYDVLKVMSMATGVPLSTLTREVKTIHDSVVDTDYRWYKTTTSQDKAKKAVYTHGIDEAFSGNGKISDAVKDVYNEKYAEFKETEETDKEAKQKAKEYVGNLITSTYKEQLIELYKTDTTKATELKRNMLEAYTAVGYDRESKNKTINEWFK